jgi:hypothetical protein
MTIVIGGEAITLHTISSFGRLTGLRHRFTRDSSLSGWRGLRKAARPCPNI